MKMKKLFIVFVLLLLVFSLAFSALANEGHVIDNADILTAAQEAELSALLEEKSQKFSLDIVVMSVEDLDGYYSARDAAAELFEEHGRGYGDDHDGIMFFFSTEYKDYFILTSGSVMSDFGDDKLYDIESATLDLMRSGNYFDAFCAFATETEKALSFDIAKSVVIALVIGLIVALIVTGSMKSKLKTVKKQYRAESYVKNGSLNITESNTLFLYSHVSRRAKPKSNSSGSFKSSSGRSYGGRGGRL